MSYRVGMPGWKLAARLGVVLQVRVEVMFDSESQRYIATSPDLDGLVCEGGSWDELVPEVHDCVGMLMQAHLHRAPKRPPYTALHAAAVAA